MAKIDQYLAAILAARKGREVRGSIHDAIALINAIAGMKFGTDVTTPISPSGTFEEGTFYLNTNTYDLWHLLGINAWENIGNLKGVDGIDGIDGEDAPYITGLKLVSQEGNVKTYEFEMSNGGTFPFTVEDGTDGADGTDGVDGKDAPIISNLELVSKIGLVRTYNLVLSDGSKFPFTVEDGQSGTGSGDMLKSVYDTDEDGVVDKAEAVGNAITSVLEKFSENSDGQPLYNGKTIAGGHELVTSKEDLEKITQTGEKVVEAFLVKQLVHEGGNEYSEIHIHTMDLIGASVTVELIQNAEGLTETVTGVIDSNNYCNIRVSHIGTYRVSVAGTPSQTVNITAFTVISLNITKFAADIAVTFNGGADVTSQTIQVTATGGNVPYSKAIQGTGGTLTVGQDNVTYAFSGTISDGLGHIANSSVASVAVAGAAGSYSAQLKFAKIDLTIVCTTSASITLTKSGSQSISYEMQSAGTQTFSTYVDAGVWTISGTIDGETISDSVGGDNYQLYTKELSASSAFITVNGSVNLAPTMPDSYVVPEGYYKPNSVDGFMVQLKDGDTEIETQTFSGGVVNFTVDTKEHTNVKLVYSSEVGFTTPTEVSLTLAKGVSKVENPIWVEKYAELQVTTSDAELKPSPVVLSFTDGGVPKTITGVWDATDKCVFICKNVTTYGITCGSVTDSVNITVLDNGAVPVVKPLTNVLWLVKDGEILLDVHSDVYVANYSPFNWYKENNYLKADKPIFSGDDGMASLCFSSPKDWSKYSKVHLKGIINDMWYVDINTKDYDTIGTYGKYRPYGTGSNVMHHATSIRGTDIGEYETPISGIESYGETYLSITQWVNVNIYKNCRIYDLYLIP